MTVHLFFSVYIYYSCIHVCNFVVLAFISCSKALLLQFLACISKEGAESGTVRSTEALSQALGGEMDLSHTQMDQRACEQLAVFLEYSEGLTELDLSHCKLTDQCMELLLPHLHKTQTLE